MILRPKNGSFLGSLANLAPEALPVASALRQSAHVYKGRPVDVWATAVTFYELVAGRPPFRGSSLTRLFDAIRKGIALDERNFFDPLRPKKDDFWAKNMDDFEAKQWMIFGQKHG